jgi:competence protein ComEC
LAGWITWVPLSYMLGLVHLVAALPGITFDVGPVAPLAVGAFYGLLLLFVARRHTRRWMLAFLSPDAWQRTLVSAVQGWPAPHSRLLLPWGLLAMALVVVLLWAAALAAPDGKLHVTFLNVGQGDAILVVTPSGRQVLVDGGPDHRRALRALGARIPFWDRSLDIVVLTHPHEDHVGGLVEVARRYRTEMAIRPPAEPASPSYQDWVDALAARAGRTHIFEAVAGQGVRLGDGVVLRVLHPGARLLAGTRSDVDNNSIVLRLEYGAVSFLLAGDIYTEAEGAMVRRGAPLKATVLKVGHHGSEAASSQEFLSAVAPALAVVSVGAENRFGHPHPQALERLHSLMPRDRVLFTSERGDIHLTTDGRRLWLETEL